MSKRIKTEVPPQWCENPGCRNEWTVTIETPGGRRWHFCGDHAQESFT